MGKGIHHSNAIIVSLLSMAAVSDHSIPSRHADELSAVSHHEEASSHSHYASTAKWTFTADEQVIYDSYNILISEELRKLVNV